MKTTIYELLGMIKDGKAPKRIVFKNNYYEWFDDDKDYIAETHWLFDEYVITDILNDEVQILETTITYKQDDYCQYQPYTGALSILKPTPYEPYTPPIKQDDKIEKLIVPNPREWLNNATLLDVKVEIRGIELKLNEIIDKLNKDQI